MKEQKQTILMLVNYIENHLQDDLDLDRIAEVSGYSKFHLNRMFAEMTGTTIHQYIKKRRLTEAAKKLVYTDNAIIEIALEAGYESHQAFSLAFKRLYKQAPQVYRRGRQFIEIQPRYENVVMISSIRCAGYHVHARSEVMAA